MKLKDKVAIITGGAGADVGGTGSAITTKLANLGAKVVVVDINIENGEKLVKQLNDQGQTALFIKCDVTSEQEIITAVEQTIKTFGKLDILINNAYITEHTTSILEVSAELWDKQFAVNVRGHFLFSKYAIPYLIKNETSSIVNISSVSSLLGDDLHTAYACAKGALNTLTSYLAAQFGRNGLRVNAVIPGIILNDQMHQYLASSPQLPPQLAIYAQNIQLNRFGKNSDIASAVAFLVSDEAEFITNAQLVVDGGLTHHASELAQMRQLAKDQSIKK
jgi:NAD(P)-dependent dehydrogenase (short-subunit alcohol dehydrogenase family)